MPGSGRGQRPQGHTGSGTLSPSQSQPQPQPQATEAAPVRAAWLEPPSPHPRPQLPDPTASVLVHRESSPGIWSPLFPFDTGQDVWPR